MGVNESSYKCDGIMMFGFMLFRYSCVAKTKTKFFKQDEYLPFQTKEIDRESLIYYINKIFRKTVIFYPLTCTSTCTYQRVRKVSEKLCERTPSASYNFNNINTFSHRFFKFQNQYNII